MIKGTSYDEENALQGLLLVRSPTFKDYDLKETIREPIKRSGNWQKRVVSDPEFSLYTGLSYFYNPDLGIIDLGDKRDGIHVGREQNISSQHFEWLLRAKSCRERNIDPPMKLEEEEFFSFKRKDPLSCTETFPMLDWLEEKRIKLDNEDRLPFSVNTSWSNPRNGLENDDVLMELKQRIPNWILLTKSKENMEAKLSSNSFSSSSSSSSSSCCSSDEEEDEDDLGSCSDCEVVPPRQQLHHHSRPAKPTTKTTTRGRTSMDNTSIATAKRKLSSISSISSVPGLLERLPTTKKKAEHEGTKGAKDLPIWVESEEADPCKCQRSHCLKRYCSCFTKQMHCSPNCICYACLNTAKLRDGDWATAYRKFVLNKPPPRSTVAVCNCSGSTGCLKRYCECFSAGVKCGGHCSCQSCKNI